MDTSTHIAMGFGLAGLSFIDPAIAANPEVAQVILLGTVLGSNAPDFDYFIKVFKGNGMYIEHHRGFSHSIPALFIWTLLISGLIWLFFTHVFILPLLCWTFLAVCLHVAFDIMNAYGTQAARPFTRKWLSLNFIPLFDPIIFITHLIGFVFWLVGVSPSGVFILVYIIVFIHMISRFLISLQVRKFLIHSSASNGDFTLVPSIWYHKWDFVLETKTTYHVGSLNGKKINWIHYFEKHDLDCPYINASLADVNVKHFLANSKHAHALYVLNSTGYEVRWIDLRFRNKNHYPYMSIVKLNKRLKITSSYTGWVQHTGQLSRKLSPPQKGVMGI